jgi:hypothetical protein
MVVVELMLGDTTFWLGILATCALHGVQEKVLAAVIVTI